MSAFKHIQFWVMVLLALSVLMPIAVTPSDVKARVMEEYSQARAIFGPAQTKSITRRANAIHRVLVVDTGLQRFIDARLTTEADLKKQHLLKDQQRAGGKAINRYLLGLSNQIYGFLFRLNVFMQWGMYIGMFLLAVIFDGVAQRRVKTDTVMSINPTAFAMSTHSLIAILFVPALYIVLPMTVTPWFTPIWSLAVAYPLCKAISNASWLG